VVILILILWVLEDEIRGQTEAHLLI